MKIVLDNMALQWKGGYISSPTQSGHFFQTVVAPFFLDKQFFFYVPVKISWHFGK